MRMWFISTTHDYVYIWNSDTDTENGWSIPHMNTNKTTTASFGQILARCPSQVSPQNKVTEDRGGSE